MTHLNLSDGDTVRIEPPDVPVFHMEPPAAPSVTVVPVVGPPGPIGPPGPVGGVDWWDGEGPPGVIVGAEPGDLYIDHLTGNLYRLT
ncbi:MAG: hypothetical protein ACRDTZ_03355 [Pseudonocardiaceae bacterium]